MKYVAPPQNALTLLGRICIAALFVPSGWGKLGNFAGLVGYIASKGVPLPEACAVIAITAELGLGLLLLLGWQTRWVALGLALFVVVITPIFHGYWAVPDAQVMSDLDATVAFFESLGWATRDMPVLVREAVRFKRAPWFLKLAMLFPDPDPRHLGNKRWGAVVRFERGESGV